MNVFDQNCFVTILSKIHHIFKMIFLFSLVKIVSIILNNKTVQKSDKNEEKNY